MHQMHFQLALQAEQERRGKGECKPLNLGHKMSTWQNLACLYILAKEDTALHFLPRWGPPPILWCCRQDNEEDTKDKGRETVLFLFFFYCSKNMWVSSTNHGIICPTSKGIRFLFQSKDTNSSTGDMLFSLLAVLHPNFLWGTLEFHNGWAPSKILFRLSNDQMKQYFPLKAERQVN